MLNLMLRRLRSQDKDVDMPDGINVRVPVFTPSERDVVDAIVTAQGHQRFQEGSSIQATVVGTGHFDRDGNSFVVIPISIFRRVGGQPNIPRRRRTDFSG